MLGICYEFLISYNSEKIWKDWVQSDGLGMIEGVTDSSVIQYRMSNFWQKTTKFTFFRKTGLELEKSMNVGADSSAALEELDKQQKAVQRNISIWLNNQNKQLFDQWYSYGLRYSLYVDIAMIDNSFNLELIPEILWACGTLKAKIALISNETFNEYELI